MKRRVNGRTPVGTWQQESTLRKVEDLVRLKHPQLDDKSFSFKMKKGHIIDDVVAWYKSAHNQRGLPKFVGQYKNTDKVEPGRKLVYSVIPKTRKTLEAFKALHGIPMRATIEAMVRRYHELTIVASTAPNIEKSKLAKDPVVGAKPPKAPTIIEEFNNNNPTKDVPTSSNPKVDDLLAQLGKEVQEKRQGIQETRVRMSFYAQVANRLNKLERGIDLLREEVSSLKEVKVLPTSEAQRNFQRTIENKMQQFNQSIKDEMETVLDLTLEEWASAKTKE